MRMINERSRRFAPTNDPRLLLALSTVVLLGGCDRSRPDPPPPPSPPTDIIPQAATPPLYPPSLGPLQGYFEGYVTIGDVHHGANGLITADGFVRMHVGGSSQDAVVDSVQFIGDVIGDASQASGTGMIVGQACAVASGRFCAETANSEISLALSADDRTLSGEIDVATCTGDETWQLNMRWPTDTYLEPGTLAFTEGMYYGDAEFDEDAEFVLDRDTIISVDAAGRLFFQSAASGCVGNGTLAPHLDSAFNVYDVTLTLELCNAPFAYVNGEFEGLATHTIPCPDDCDWLGIYLASTEGAGSRTAVTLWARR